MTEQKNAGWATPEESALLLRAIFPAYPTLLPCHPCPQRPAKPAEPEEAKP